MLLRTAVLFTALIGTNLLPCWCQQASKPSVSDLLTELRSKHWAARSGAVYAIESHPETLHSREVRAELMNLLDEEDRGTAPSGEDHVGEEWAEYFASLRGIVASFADWNDARQACVMVNAASVDYPSSLSPTEAAGRARAAMPCILKMAKSKQAADREIAIPMLLEALAVGRDALDSRTVQGANQIVMNNLHDPDSGVRAFTVGALSNFGGPDVIPTLQDIARSDPTSEKTNNGSQWFPIREFAVKAIAEIQKREPQR